MIEAHDFANVVEGQEIDGAMSGEEVFAANEGKSSDPYDMILTELEVLMMDEALNERVDAFTTEHCGVFESGEENKLVYTTLFTEYTAMIEAYIEERLGASVKAFDMAGFCATLAQRAKTEDALPPALEMLHSMADFDAFKELMLSAKAGMAAEAAGGLLCVSGAPMRVGLGSDVAGLPGLDTEDTADGDAEGTLAPELDDALSISAIGRKA